MCPDRQADPDDGSSPGHRSEISGSASDVVQARDVHGGVHFHGVDAPGGPVPRQLPGDVGGFVNRLRELARLNEVMADDRGEPLVVGVYVITGTAGVGKTSLVLHWAHSARRRFADGQLYVNLRGYDPGPPVSPEEALDRFLRALGVSPGNIPVELEDRAALYRSMLADRRMLVVLDNAATVRQVRPLLPGNAECLVLVTSRSRLSGLVARDGARRLTLDVLSEDEAVGLLRAITVGYRHSDNPAELVELARLCARLPLALRIAAERASSRPLMLLNELIADLRDESALWGALTAEDDEEADAVRTVFAWSYRALPEAAARLFRRLGLHPGPEFGIPAAAALAGISISQARQLLNVLVGAHVVEQQAPGRYQFHDLLRAYATNLALDQETAESRRSALEQVVIWYLRAAHAAATTVAPFNRHIVIDTSTDVPWPRFATASAAFEWYEVERANLVAATRAAAAAELHQLAWQLSLALRVIYARQNFFDDWLTTSHIGLDAARRNHDQRGEAELLDSLGRAYLQSHRLSEAEEHHRGALAVRREMGDRYGEGVSINALGLLDWRRRRLDSAVSLFEEAITVFRELGDRRWEALMLSNLGMAYRDLGELTSAVEALDTSVAICREVGDRPDEGNALFVLAMAQREQGLVSEALATIEHALAIARDESHHAWEAFWLLELARIQRLRGQADEALTSCQRSATIQRRLGDRSREAMALDGTGEVYRELGRADEAAKFHRLAVLTHRELGDRWSLAIALANLATAVAETGEPDDARSSWSEAMAALADFDDPRAVRMREQIIARLQVG
jgi:tetratricopeptide (TPR) repeat protein